MAKSAARVFTTLYDADGVPLTRRCHIEITNKGKSKHCISADHATAYLQSHGVAITRNELYNILREGQCKNTRARLDDAGFSVNTL